MNSRLSTFTAGNAVRNLEFDLNSGSDVNKDIESVSVASHKAEFLHHDPLTTLTLTNSKDCHAYPELKRKLFSALMECEEGELSIGIPGQVSLKQVTL